MEIVTKNQLQDAATAATAVKLQVTIVQKVMRSVMQEGQHYGIIQGCGDKPVLLKAGAEKLLATFNLGIDPEIETVDKGDSATYRVKCRIFNIETGKTVGFGVGECSTNEDKYRWRKAVSEAEWENTPEERRRIKYIKSSRWNPTGEIKQVRVNYKDIANTCLKMAKKRAMVDATLTATAASDIFTQDIEEEYSVEDQEQKLIETQSDSPIPTVSKGHEIDSALKSVGLLSEEKQGWIKVIGNTYGKQEILKSLGFRWKPDKKIWVKKVA